MPKRFLEEDEDEDWNFALGFEPMGDLIEPNPPLTVEDLQRRVDIARNPKPRIPDFQCVYGRLNLQGQRHELSWTPDRPFRVNDLLFWGQSERTVIERFVIGNPESDEDNQLVGELPVAFALINPYPFQQVFEMLVEPPSGGVLLGVRLESRLRRANDGMLFKTASIGETLSLVVRGPVAHVLLVGNSV